MVRKQTKKENPNSTEEEVASATESQEIHINLYRQTVLSDKQSQAAQAKKGTVIASTMALREFYEAIPGDLADLREDDETITGGGLVVKWLELHSDSDIGYCWDRLDTPLRFVMTASTVYGPSIVLNDGDKEHRITFNMVKRHIDKYVRDLGE